jgi:hypothetical protein
VTARVRFVDSISTTAGIRLDVQVDPDWAVMRNGLDLSPAALRSLAPESMMRDGAPVVATARGNMLLRLPILLKGATADGQQSLKSSLDRECDRPLNFLEWRTLDATESRWLVCYRSAVVEYDPFYGQNLWHATVELHCQPFAYGVRRDLGTVTVNPDPAAASNPNYFDVTGVAGDVETPLLIKWPSHQSSPNSASDVWAVRRRGTPANAPFLVQCESMTLGADASLITSADYSGSGSNAVQVSFAGTPGMAARVTAAPFPASVDVRGLYRVYLRVSTTDGTSDILVQLGVGSDVRYLDVVSVPASIGFERLLDMGLVQIPLGRDPVTDGLGGAEMPVDGIPILVEASRAGGTASLDLDYLLFVPADDRQCSTEGKTFDTTDLLVLDTSVDEMHAVSADGTTVTELATGIVRGGAPWVSPGVTNRIYLLRRVGAAQTHWISGVNGPTTDVDVSYYPRYLSV